MPRRFAQFEEGGQQIYSFLVTLHPLVLFVTVAAIVTVITQFLFFFNFFWSIWKGEKTDANPWQATTIEWAAPSPPPHGNFLKSPEAYRGPYEYSVPGAPKDFLAQHEA